MKHLFMALALLSLAGCARAKIVSWEEQDMVVCGNAFCDRECYAKVINDACYAGWQVKGAYVDTWVSGASYSGGESSVNYQSRACSKIHCMGPLFQSRQPSSKD